ncbi:MAG: DUF167 domain-containing protein [Bacteroidetes bacterium]|nr:MAG: DUF167 domain-containing protein [Bacteroidota bacterium]REJ99682.1 MAG: DUF167 domain-containing protein [Bacteroidota bacterium]REK33915.1 MAG: DUF167 domain-containing protein [Bacteroidota bacterium]REK47680.1 MAG: DUF167 domain-containing protein [Bacteroidota bacterium]
MYFFISVKPNSKVEKIEKKDGEWMIRINAPALAGKANERLIEFLAGMLNLPKSKLHLVKGKTGRLKCIQIDAETEYVHAMLEQAMDLKVHKN